MSQLLRVIVVVSYNQEPTAMQDPEPTLPPPDPDPDPLAPPSLPEPDPDEPGPDLMPQIDPAFQY